MTKQIIKSASREDLHQIQSMIKALRSGDKKEIAKYEDLSIYI